MAKKDIKTTSNTIANRRLFRRTVILLVIFGIVVFIPVVGKLWKLQIVQHDELEEMAVNQQTSTSAVSSARGSIYDADGNVLAISSTAYDVIISPKAIVEKQAELDEEKEAALEKGQNIADYDKDVEELVVQGMADILDLDASDIREMCQNTESQYKRLAIKVETSVENEIRTYIEENDLSGCIYLQANTKRYYPYGSMASQIIGFTNDSGGAYGLEAKFDDELTGTDGLVVSAQNANGQDLMNFFQEYYDAEDGSNLHLTIDTGIQTICESLLADAVEKYYVKDGGCIIVMDCDTGAILGMASSPTYDLNNYGVITDEALLANVQEQVDAALEEDPEQDEEELYNTYYAEAVEEQWRNKAINDTYEPGSTFKSVVLSAALEEGVTDINDSFYCEGYIEFDDYTIRCSNRNGHGAETLAEAVGNSCNPVFITLGQRLGRSTFYDYLEAYGIVDASGGASSTGIDLPGEGQSIVWTKTDFGIYELATASFGQRFNVTPIQMITAVNAVVNGGYYYQPYVVDYIEDANGAITYSADTTPLRQVISESTSATCREILEGVVGNGLGGKNAYRAGYRIGGKTGTSETLVDGEYDVSFVGFAPADDPEIVVLVVLNNPENAGSDATPDGTYISGGTMAAPVAGDLIVDVLDYLDYGRQYTASEITGPDTIVPYLVGYTVDYAEAVLDDYGFTYKVVGEGDGSSIVENTRAIGGTYIPEGNQIVLYIGGAEPPETITMPNLVGLSPDEAASVLVENGLYMKATGASSLYTEYTRVYGQSVAEGEQVAPGTVITVSFNDPSYSGNETDDILTED